MRFLITSLCFLCLFIQTFAQSAGKLPTLTDDGAWCWFSDPRSIYHKGEKECIYTGWVTRGGDIVISSYNINNKEYNTKILAPKFQRDDHNNPSILFLPDGRLLVTFNKHNGGMYYCRSINPEDISEFEPVIHHDLGSRMCYTNPVMLSEEDNRIYVFFRSGTNWKPGYIYSDDLGKTWSKEYTLVSKPGTTNSNRPYTKVVSDGKSSIHFAFTDGHPREENHNSIYYLKYDKGKLFDASGKVLGKMGEPVNQLDIPKIYDGVENNSRGWIWDIALDKENNPSVVYTRMPEETMHYYMHARWNGKEWVNSQIAFGGKDFPRKQRKKEERNPEPHYSGGINIDHSNPSVIYLSKPVNDVFEIFKYTLVNEKWEEEQITKGSDKDNVRPFVVRNMPEKKGHVLMWMYNFMYEHYTMYWSAIKVIGLEN